MKIVIANSIGIDKNGAYIIHSPSRWSEGVANVHHWFAYYPWELAYLSSLLKKETQHQVCFVDGCLEKLNAQAYLQKILDMNPEVLVMESATRMIDENVQMALTIKKQLGTKLVFVGSHASVFAESLLEKGIDYVCIGEYEYSVLELVQRNMDGNIKGLYPNARRSLLDVNSLPWPEDEDISRLAYGKPGEPSSEYLEIQMYGSRGCPMSCDFCVARNVYYDQPNWRGRNVSDIVNEIAYLQRKYPELKGIFFDEEVHSGSREFIKELTQGVIKAGLQTLQYEAMCDSRLLDQQMLQKMKDAGYYKIRIGIETASDRIMKAINKTIDMGMVREKLGQAKQVGLKTYGTFTIGAWGSDRKEDSKTIQLIKELINDGLLDNLQISICTPQPGTPFYQKIIENGFLIKGLSWDQYDGGNTAVVSYPNYTAKSIKATYKRALLMRDHCFLQAKIRQKNFLVWIKSIYKRYGLIGFVNKAVRRLWAEIRYLTKII